MYNVWLIARREYLERVRTRGFIITTILIPLIMAGFVLGSSYFAEKSKTSWRIAAVSADTQFVLDLQDQLQSDNAAASADGAGAKSPHKRIHVTAMNPGADTRQVLDEELDSGYIDGYLWAASPVTAGSTLTAKSPDDQQFLRSSLGNAIGKVLARKHASIAAGGNLYPTIVPVQPHRISKREEHDSAVVSVTVLFFVMYMVIMLYGMNVARSIIEEKTSRIFEVLLATIRPEEMMAGKILGVGSVGLTQVGIWIAMVLTFGSSLAARVGADSIHIGLSASQTAYFFVYFLLGYVFYSSIAAALGAMTNSEQELQQLNMFLVLPLAVCLVVMHNVISYPDSSTARIMALIPPFTPLLMYLRVSLGHPNPWDIVASIGLTIVSIYGIIWVTSRIYRVGVLMYGKRPNLSELLRWLKYS